MSEPRTIWNRERKRKGLCLSCGNKVGPQSTVRCDSCHFRKLASERGTGDRERRSYRAQDAKARIARLARLPGQGWIP